MKFCHNISHIFLRLLPRVVRDKYTKGPKGYGFVSFLDANDFSRAFKEMQSTYIFNRPCKLSKSKWGERTVAVLENGKTKKFKQSVSNAFVLKTCHKTKNALISKRNKKHHICGIQNRYFVSSELFS